MWTPCFGASRRSSTSGVLPIRSRSDGATTVLRTAGHCGKQDDRAALAHRRLESVQRAHVLALDVDVHERREVLVLDQLLAQRRESSHQVLEQLADVLAVGLDLPLAVRLRAQRRWNANGTHAAAPSVGVFGWRRRWSGRQSRPDLKS